MAHSYLEFRGRSQHFNDLDIRALVHCALDVRQHVGTDAALPSSIDKMLEEWREQLAIAAPGCWDLGFDMFLPSESDVEALLELLDMVEDKVKSFGEVVPGAYLNELEQSEIIEYYDRPTERMIDVVSKVRDLLSARD